MCSQHVASTVFSYSMKQRLVADPCIGVGDLLQCVEAFLDEAGNNGLQAHLQPPANMNWKTAPNPAWLCRLSNLWRKYLALAPNAVIPSKKHRLALEKLQERRSGVNTGKKNQQDFAEACDEWIRIGLSHLRFLKQSDINRSRCFRKCDPDEIATLETVLGLITEIDGETDDSQQSQGSPPPAAADPSKQLALVPQSRPVGGAEPAAAGKKDPLAIFTAVNSRPSFVEGGVQPQKKQIASLKATCSLEASLLG